LLLLHDGAPVHSKAINVCQIATKCRHRKFCAL